MKFIHIYRDIDNRFIFEVWPTKEIAENIHRNLPDEGLVIESESELGRRSMQHFSSNGPTTKFYEEGVGEAESPSSIISQADSPKLFEDIDRLIFKS